MQGEQVESSIIAALDSIAEHSDNYDAVVIIRGGGAVSDLQGFESYLLASNVAQFPLPVLTGIGHERDEMVIDLVAHTRNSFDNSKRNSSKPPRGNCKRSKAVLNVPPDASRSPPRSLAARNANTCSASAHASTRLRAARWCNNKPGSKRSPCACHPSPSHVCSASAHASNSLRSKPNSSAPTASFRWATASPVPLDRLSAPPTTYSLAPCSKRRWPKAPFAAAPNNSSGAAFYFSTFRYHSAFYALTASLSGFENPTFRL